MLLLTLPLFACTEPLPTQGSFSVLSYNVHGLPSVITGDDTPDRMLQIAPLLVEHDLIGLQEDFDDANHQALVADAPHAFQERFSAEVEDSRAYGSGLGVLSVMEILQAEGIHYTQCYGGVSTGSGDCLASKGFQWVRLSLGEGEIDVLNTHMEAGGGDEDNAARLSHAVELTEYALAQAGERSVVIIGDTNLHGDDPDDLEPLQVFWDAGFEDVCDILGCAEPGRIDRILLRPGSVDLTPNDWRVEPWFDPDGVPLSDHDPIAVDLAWSTE